MAPDKQFSLWSTLAACALLAACGSSTPTPAPTPGPIPGGSLVPASAAPPAPMATAAQPLATAEAPSPPTASPSGPVPPTPLPSFSFTPDPALAAEFPATIQGADVQVTTYHARDVYASIAGDKRTAAAFNALLAAVGRPMEDVTLGTGAVNVGEEFASLAAIRVPGVKGAAMLEAVSDFTVASQAEPTSWVRSETTVGGKPVVALTSSVAEPPGAYPPIYLYGHGDTVFTLVASSISPVVMAALP